MKNLNKRARIMLVTGIAAIFIVSIIAVIVYRSAKAREAFATDLSEQEEEMYIDTTKTPEKEEEAEQETPGPKDPQLAQTPQDLQIMLTETEVKEIEYETAVLISRNKAAEARDYLDGKLKDAANDLAYLYIKIDEAERFQTELEPYTGPVEHFFTHCLIAFPEICYSGSDMMKHLDNDCITVNEFKQIIQSFYDNGYILIDINLLIEDTDEAGKVKRAELMLPKGKKPLILSVDDVTYDARKASTGMVDKLITDERGRVATYTKHKDGAEIISYDNEVFPILDSFVIEHPDFSFNGAKGTLALTGFQGILGYRTQSDAPEGTDYEAEKEGALRVVQALKAYGWNFGSHSYGHSYMNKKLSEAGVREDTTKWLEEVGSLVGETKIFFYPFGDSIKYGDAKFNILHAAGFRVFCGVGNKQPYVNAYSGGEGIFQDRRVLDGYALRNLRDYYLPFFDTDEIFDPLRPRKGLM